MKKSGIIMLMAMVLGVAICGIGFAADFAAPEGAQPPAALERAQGPADILQPDSIELTGTVLSDNTFVDENGENYQLLESETSEDLMSYVGQKIKVTATVMESDEGLKNISISSYELLEQ
jgi:hypothetical protein